MLSAVERFRAYAWKMPPSVQGSNGSTAIYNVARKGVKDFDLPEDVLFPVLMEWNAAFSMPPWNEAEIRHKIRSARQSPGPVGALLNGGFHAAAGGGNSTSFEDAEARKKEHLRKSWPARRRLSLETRMEIAALRGVSLEAVELLHHFGILRGCMYRDHHGDGREHRCFVICEGTFMQVRRLDGGTLTSADGEPIKSKNLSGSQGAFLGRKWLGAPECPVLITEGGVALLEALSAALSVGADLQRPHGWTIVSATSAVSRFDAEWLRRLSGRRVRIVPDTDAAGREACAKWTASLRGAGCEVDAIQLPDPYKDLGDAMKSPDGPALAAAIFTL